MTYAVVPTRDRPELLRRTVTALLTQVDRVLVLDHASAPPVHADDWLAGVTVVRDDVQPVNLSRLWNRALELVSAVETANGSTAWNVALLCDDAPPPPGWVDAVCYPMRDANAAAASTHSYAAVTRAYLLTARTNDRDRMCPWAFMLPGERGLRADESMAWWFCDTDLDWQARASGGTLVVPGPVVDNLLVGDYTARDPLLAAQAARDEATFNAKWGLT